MHISPLFSNIYSTGKPIKAKFYAGPPLEGDINLYNNGGT